MEIEQLTPTMMAVRGLPDGYMVYAYCHNNEGIWDYAVATPGGVAFMGAHADMARLKTAMRYVAELTVATVNA